MDIAQWTKDLSQRLEGSADTIDDLANSDWVPSEDLRDRLFGLEAHIWRVSRQIRKSLTEGVDVAWLARSLGEIRDAVSSCVQLRACEDEDALAQLESLADEIDTVRRVTEVLATRVKARCAVAGARS